MRRLTVPEVTRLLAEAIHEHAKEEWPPEPDQAAAPRLCVVIEEAHSLVPEGGSSDRNEAAAAARTSPSAVSHARRDRI